jgi:uncharacterized protein (DUF58 family)
MEKSLNLDIPGRICELEVLIKKVLPKNVIYRLVLSKGIEFEGYRDYTPEDDAGNIDWKASVRAGHLFVRRYIEEKDLRFMFLIDISENMVFGSTEKLKCEYCAELVASLAHLIIVNEEAVGYALYNNKIIKFSRPSVGNKQFEGFCSELSDPENYGGLSNLDSVLNDFIPTLDLSLSMIFLVSDFIKMDKSYIKNLEILSSMFEIVAIIIRDPLDRTLPEINKEIIIEDSETGTRMLINPKLAKKNYEINAIEQIHFVKKMFINNSIDFLDLTTNESSSEKIAEFLINRIKNKKSGRI